MYAPAAVSLDQTPLTIRVCSDQLPWQGTSSYLIAITVCTVAHSKSAGCHHCITLLLADSSSSSSSSSRCDGQPNQHRTSYFGNCCPSPGAVQLLHFRRYACFKARIMQSSGAVWHCLNIGIGTDFRPHDFHFLEKRL